MAAIKEIEIAGFKAFPNKFSIELNDGKNLLIYGENGSGKSSLYYALHVILQSVFKDDKGAKYFTPGEFIDGKFIVEDQNLININRFDETKANTYHPYIRIELDNGKIWRLDRGGLSSENGGNESDLKMLNKDSAFINHSYISRFHSARNSEGMNLWNVFHKDILPFYIPAGETRFLADLYDEIVKDCSSQPSMKNKMLQDKIVSFNELLSVSINRINTKVNAIYGENFKNESDKSLEIKLIYYSDENPDNKLKEHFYLYYGNIRHNRKIGKVDLYAPKIGIEIKENGILINKPQSHFNEAKLTAIALSVRFACMTSTSITSGAFLALDDMLISLDMSNRAKVVKFLLDISDKYKIYLFTHDQAFYNYMCRTIKQHGSASAWIYKTISYNPKDNKPIVIDEYSDYISKAKHFYEIGDYETSAIYTRKELEQSIEDLLPFELKVSAERRFVSLETLWKKLVTFYSNNQKPLDLSMRKIFSESKMLILNVAAHYQRLSNPIYKIELDRVFRLIDYIHSLDKIENKLVVEKDRVILFTHPTIDYKCSFMLDSDLEIIKKHTIAKNPKCKNIRWSYNNIENWDFETNAQNNNHVLLSSTPKLTNFFKNCCEKLPLGITYEMLKKHSVINDRPLLDYLDGIELSELAIKIDND